VPDSLLTDHQTHEMAARLAVRCRRIVQACLREEEWLDADREFYLIIRAGMDELLAGQSGRESGT
jgi:hypothetical protein